VDALWAQLATLHPYEQPECLVVPVDEGDPAYLAWVTAESADASS
jgi:periplasmic divalent cation tolerance protein